MKRVVLLLCLLAACDGTPGGPVSDPGVTAPDVKIVSELSAEPLDFGDWAVQVVLENQGGDGEFRLLIWADEELTRETDVHPLNEGEQFGSPPSTMGGFFSPGPQRPTLIVVESRRRNAPTWMETDRGEIPAA